MAVNEFYVTSRVDKWYVDNGNENHGPYLSQRDAIADAIEAAQQLSSNRKPTAVLLKLQGAKAAVIWNSRQAMRDLVKADLDTIRNVQ
jgi:hypothetical protein